MSGIRRSREFWKRVVGEVGRHGGVREVARRHGLRANTLAWWCWRLRDDEEPNTAPKPSFLPVVVAKRTRLTSADARMVELQIGSVRVRVEAGTDVDYVVALARGLAGC